MNKLFTLGVFSLSFFSGLAYGSCVKENLEGVYKNRSGDSFQIKQPTCDSIILVDMQLDDEYDGSFTNPANQLTLGSSTSIPYAILKFFPLTFSMDRSDWENDTTRITFNSRIKLKQKDTALGLTSPLLQISLTIQADGRNDENFGKANLSTSPTLLMIYISSIQAVEDPNSSFAQRALIRGINIGISVFEGLGIVPASEQLYRVR